MNVNTVFSRILRNLPLRHTARNRVYSWNYERWLGQSVDRPAAKFQAFVGPQASSSSIPLTSLGISLVRTLVLRSERKVVSAESAVHRVPRS